MAGGGPVSNEQIKQKGKRRNGALCLLEVALPPRFPSQKYIKGKRQLSLDLGKKNPTREILDF